MGARWVLAIVALTAACGGHEHPTLTPDAPIAQPSAAQPAPAPKNRAETLSMATAACVVGQLWIDAEGDAATPAERSAASRECKTAVRVVGGEDDPSQIEALRMFDASLVASLATKVKELAATDGLDDDRAAALEKFDEAIVSAAHETASARRAAAKIRGDIEKIKNERLKQAARDRVATRLSPSEATAAPALHAAGALVALVRLPEGAFADDAHAAALVLALARVRAAQDLPRHMKLYVAGPALAAVFGVATPPLGDHAGDHLKPNAWLAYVTSVAKACGHPIDAGAPAKDRERLAFDAALAGLADRLAAVEPTVTGKGLATIVHSAIASVKPATP